MVRLHWDTGIYCPLRHVSSSYKRLLLNQKIQFFSIIICILYFRILTRSNWGPPFFSATCAALNSMGDRRLLVYKICTPSNINSYIHACKYIKVIIDITLTLYNKHFIFISRSLMGSSFLLFLIFVVFSRMLHVSYTQDLHSFC